jgi:hypothetical protein
MEVVCDEFGTNPGDYLDYLASGLGAEMASQQKLGLWTKRRPRSGFGDHSDSPLVGAHLSKRRPKTNDLEALLRQLVPREQLISGTGGNREERKASAKMRKASSLRSFAKSLRSLRLTSSVLRNITLRGKALQIEVRT